MEFNTASGRTSIKVSYFCLHANARARAPVCFDVDDNNQYALPFEECIVIIYNVCINN